MSDPDSAGAEGSPERSVEKTVPLTSKELGDSAFGSREVKSGAAKAAPSSEVLSRLIETRTGMPRYQVKEEIARGGMGAILQVWDGSLDRPLAMKVILESGSPESQSPPSPVNETRLTRFLEEARVTGQLDHPGIVPVHELGVDSEGRVFFTMKLVKGRDLKTIFNLVFAGNEGWNETRALGVLLKVCEAMAYAHAKGVIHRDLKPANVMVGDFGEVYVMDWGLARVQGKKDAHGLKLRPDGVSLSSLKTERRREREEAPDSPLITMDGIVVGTPAYMPPEQARGDVEALGPRSDVYSIGAMLYHLLARQMPYVPSGARISTRTILAAVIQGPPTPLATLRRDAPAELVAIVDKAMAQERERRYASTLELADDLRAFLENRVVTAYETGPIAELRKWVVRNKPLAATIAAALLGLVAAILLVNDARIKANEARADADRNATAAKESEAKAKENEIKAEIAAEAAQREKDEVLRLADVQRLKDLETDSARLWPAHLENVAGIEDWLGRARELAGRLPAHRERLGELAEQAFDSSEERERGSSKFRHETIAWQHEVMAGLVRGIESLTRDDRNWSAVTIAALERRLEFATTVRQTTIDDESAAWDLAIARIAASEEYGGLKISPQLGLVPLWEDPESGLFEFWHVQSGERPRRDEDGRIVPHAAMGIVLVLIPGGTFTMGSPKSEADRLKDEDPSHEVTLEAYFISKYEMTQGQWSRLAGQNPSNYKPPQRIEGRTITLLNPVEQVSWEDCSRLLPQIGLDLPTEAQWERAARGGTATPWWMGPDKDSLRGRANISDESYGRAGGNKGNIDLAENDDGHAVHAPVGAFPANPYGLHEVAGNVWEWCRDWSGGYRLPLDPADGERQVPAAEREARVGRGGSFGGGTALARSASRHDDTPEYRAGYLGVRPARRVAPR